MARSYGRIFAAIWNDDDFRPLSVTAKLMYGFLISQTDLAHSGIIPLRPPRWARNLGISVEDVIAALKELDQARFTVTDEDWGELLVRSLIRRDDIWKQPNVFKSAAASAKASESPAIKAALLLEVRRLDLTGVGRETRTIRDDLLAHLEPFENPSPNPPEGFPKGSGSPLEGHESPNGRVSADRSVDNTDDAEISAGQNPSAILAEAQPNHSAGPTGKGEGYGPVLEVAFPPSPTPSPLAAPEPVRPLWPAAVPDVRAEGEEDQSGDETQDLTGLVAKVRELRPDWSSRSITRAMADEAVTERPWPLAVAAMLAVAADPASEHPGRVSHDGPWWKSAKTVPSKPRWPPWCGTCRESTRRLEDEDGYDAGPCPNCNPKARAS